MDARPRLEDVNYSHVMALASSGSVDEMRALLGAMGDDSMRTAAVNASDRSERSVLSIAAASKSTAMVSLVRRIITISQKILILYRN